jgi:hypothetical protein
MITLKHVLLCFASFFYISVQCFSLGGKQYKVLHSERRDALQDLVLLKHSTEEEADANSYVGNLG